MCSPKFEVMQRGVCPIRAPLYPGSHIFSPSLPITCSSLFLSDHRTELQSPQATSPKSKSHSTPRILKMGPCGDCNCCSSSSCGDSCKCTSCGVRLFSPSPKNLV